MQKNHVNGVNGKANGKTAEAQSGLTTTPLPASRKVYVEGTQSGVRVPFREISLTPAHAMNGHSPAVAAPVRVYDTSGPYTDPQVQINVRQGLTPIRLPWIEARQDSEQLSDISSEYGRPRAADALLASLRFPNIRRPRRPLARLNVIKTL